jgi:hypothetical protein
VLRAAQGCIPQLNLYKKIILFWAVAFMFLVSVAGAAKDAQVQNVILLSDFTQNLVVVGRQPYPDPNFASYVRPGRPHRLALALPRAA